MHVEFSVILAVFSILTSIVSVVVFINKLRWEVDMLKRENAEQFKKLECIEKELISMRESGSIPTKELGRRMDEIEAQLSAVSGTVNSIMMKLVDLSKGQGI